MNRYTLKIPMINDILYVRKDYDGEPMIGINADELDDGGTLIMTTEEMFDMAFMPTPDAEADFCDAYDLLMPDPVKVQWLKDNEYDTFEEDFFELWGMTMSQYLATRPIN